MIADDPRVGTHPGSGRRRRPGHLLRSLQKYRCAGLGLEKMWKNPTSTKHQLLHTATSPGVLCGNFIFIILIYIEYCDFPSHLGCWAQAQFGTFLVGSSHWPRANVCCQKAIKQNKPGGGKTATCFRQKIWDMSDPGSYDFLQVIHCTTFVALRSMSSWNHPVSWVVLPDGYAGQHSQTRRNAMHVSLFKMLYWLVLLCSKILLRWLVSVRPNVKLFIYIYYISWYLLLNFGDADGCAGLHHPGEEQRA